MPSYHILYSHDYSEREGVDNTFILLDVLLCSLAEYSYELCRIYKYKFRGYLLCVTEVCEAERNWRGIGQQQEISQTCLTGPMEYKYRVIFVLVLGVICTLPRAVG